MKTNIELEKSIAEKIKLNKSPKYFTAEEKDYIDKFVDADIKKFKEKGEKNKLKNSH